MSRSRKEVSLVRTFVGPRILTLEQLCRRVELSRSSVMRRLKEHGYHSSYNWAGRFLTIDEVADFDSRGLWFYKEARFSRDGTLKQTVGRLIAGSEGGMTHDELATILGVRAHNSLLDLVREKRIGREHLGPTFVYLSTKSSVKRKQVQERESLLAREPSPRPTSRQTVAILLELIKDPEVTRGEIVKRCKRAGVVLSREMVDVLFEIYSLDKKRAL